MEGLTEGRIVHYVMPSREHRPAIVVRAWKVQEAYHDGITPETRLATNGMCNLVVFVDGVNDVKRSIDDPCKDHVLTMWETSVVYSEEPKPFTWHWIEKA